jgi:hypothetical protein
MAEGAEDRFVTNNLGTLLTALYVDLDDRVLPALGWPRQHRAGRKPALSGAGLACVTLTWPGTPDTGTAPAIRGSSGGSGST